MKKIAKLFFAICIFILLVSNSIYAGDITEEGLDNILKYFRSDVSFNLRTASVSIINHKENQEKTVNVVNCHDKDDYINKIPGEESHRGDPETGFGLGSFGKTYVAYLILKLHEDDMLDLDETVGNWLYSTDDPLSGVLPYTDYYKNRIDENTKIRHLLNHAAKVRNFDSQLSFMAEVVADIDEPWTVADTLYYIPYSWWYSDPLYGNKTISQIDNDSEYVNYSNSHYVLLGAIIQQAIKKAYPNNTDIQNAPLSYAVNYYLKDKLELNFTNMLGVKKFGGQQDEYLLINDSELSPMAWGYESGFDNLFYRSSTIVGVAAKSYYTSILTCGNMVASAEDCAKFIKECFDYQKLMGYIEKQGEVHVARSPIERYRNSQPWNFGTAYMPTNPDYNPRPFYAGKIAYGNGLEYYKHINLNGSETEIWGHRGTQIGYHCTVYYLPKEEISVAILTNQHSNASTTKLLHAVLEYIQDPDNYEPVEDQILNP